MCVNQRANCQVYDIRGRCTKCLNNFVLQNGQCRVYLPFCLAYSNDQQTCTNCAQGTNLVGGCCQLQDSFCLNYVNCACTGCMSGYYLNAEGRCQANPQGCAVFNSTNNTCITCVQGFYLMPNGLCISSQFITNGCLEGFNITYLQSVGYQCIRCIEGFVLNP